MTACKAAPAGPPRRASPRRRARAALCAVLAALCLAGVGRAGAGEVILRERDLTRDLRGGWTASGLVLPDPGLDVPSVDPRTRDAAPSLLRSLIDRGVAHGFDGMLYDNRDRGHSRLDPALFPRLTHLSYGPRLRDLQADYGRAGLIELPFMVLGNSSTALTAGVNARSLSRLAMTSPPDQARSARLYMSNHLYVYPEHRDYDAVDLYPANWPYHVISQGSSGSDRPFLEALAATMGAFPTETVERMRAEGLLAPTLQMILRRNLAFVDGVEAYLSGPAHRPVLSSEDLRPSRMVATANAMTPADVPPLVRLAVEEEDFAVAAGLGQMSETLFTTPAAIARIWRGFAWEKSMIVSTAPTDALGNADLRFHWRVLQGAPGKVTVEPLDPRGTRARITLTWHDPLAIEETGRRTGPARTSSRVDIGVFADNGRTMSAPALVSVAFPTHQIRRYGPAEDDPEIRLREIDYDAKGREVYFDPMVQWSAPWTDRAIYDPDGRLTGWDRRYSDPAREDARVAHPPLFPRYGFESVRGRIVLNDDPEAAAGQAGR